MPVDLHQDPLGGWTPENIRAYQDEWWRQELTRPLSPGEDIEDPEGRLRKGIQCRWKDDVLTTGPQMEIVRISGDLGLYRRPVTPQDRDGTNGRTCQMLAEMVDDLDRINPEDPGIPCKQEDPGAVYQPKNLVVLARELATGKPMTVRAYQLVDIKP